MRIISQKAGLGVAAIGAMPSVGLYFGVYSYSKQTLIPRMKRAFGPTRERGCIISDNAATTIGIATSAAIGNTFASFSRVPYEVVKQQLQTGQYPNTRKALTAMFRSEGMRAFFPMGGVSIQMVRDIPCALICFLLKCLDFASVLLLCFISCALIKCDSNNHNACMHLLFYFYI